MTASLRRLNRASGSLPILLRLYLDGPTSKTELTEALDLNHETVTTTVATLEELDLVSVQEEKRFPRRHQCELTPRGRKLVAAPLHDWPSLLRR